MKFRIALIAIFAITQLACSNPHNAEIPSDISNLDELKPIIQKLPEEEKKLLTAYLIRMKMSEAFGGGQRNIGLTVGTAISEQKKWIEEQKAKEAEAKALKEKVEKERAALKKKVEETLTVAVIELELQKADYRAGIYQDYQKVKIALQNKGAKDIKGVQGDIKFIDIFDKVVGTISFGYDDGIAVGQTKTWVGARKYNQFLDEDKAIANLEEGKYTIRFEPTIIIFSDDTKLKIPE